MSGDAKRQQKQKIRRLKRRKYGRLTTWMHCNRNQRTKRNENKSPLLHLCIVYRRTVQSTRWPSRKPLLHFYDLSPYFMTIYACRYVRCTFYLHCKPIYISFFYSIQFSRPKRKFFLNHLVLLLLLHTYMKCSWWSEFHFRSQPWTEKKWIKDTKIDEEKYMKRV